MDRIILFRGRTECGAWIEGSLLDYQSGEKAILNRGFSKYGYEATEIYKRSMVIPETVGQFTGLHDKNGAKIFEGDKLNWIQFNFTVVCEWDKDLSKFFLKAPNKLDSIGITRFTRNEFEIIGNIHEGDK